MELPYSIAHGNPEKKCQHALTGALLYYLYKIQGYILSIIYKYRNYKNVFVDKLLKRCHSLNKQKRFSKSDLTDCSQYKQK